MSFGKNVLRDLKFISCCLVYPQREKALYVGYTGYGNLGDEALKKCIFELLEPSFLFSESQGFLVRSLRKLGFLKFKMLVLGGGTFILNAFHPQSHLNFVFEENIPRKISFGTGVVDPLFPENPLLAGDIEKWVNVLDNFSYVSVRGPLSAQILKDNNVRKPIHVIGDPAFYFIRDIQRLKAKSKYLGLNIGPAISGKRKGVLWGRDEKRFLFEFTIFMRLMLNEGWRLGFVPVCREDENLIKSLLKDNKLQHKVDVFKFYNDTEKTIDHLEKFDVFVGEKLHSVVLAYCANTPAVMLEYRPKCRDFMASIDMESLNVRTDQLNAFKLKEMVEDLYANVETVRLNANQTCKNYKENLIQASMQVVKL